MDTGRTLLLRGRPWDDRGEGSPVDTASRVRQVAIDAALDGNDLMDALPRLVRVSRSRTALRDAVGRLEWESLRDPTDPVLVRAIGILNGALTTSLYTESQRRWGA